MAACCRCIDQCIWNLVNMFLMLLQAATKYFWSHACMTHRDIAACGLCNNPCNWNLLLDLDHILLGRLQVGSSSGGSAFVGNFGASKQLNGLVAATRNGLSARPSFMGAPSGAGGSPGRGSPAAGPSRKGAFSKWTSRVRERSGL